MIRQYVLIAIVAASLSGCGSVGGVTPSVGSIIDQVRATTSTVCAFLPTVETVANILATGNPLLTTATDVANAICAAVAPKVAGTLRRATAPAVAGVAVHGKFLR